MKLDRLFGILSALLERDRITSRELAERFEVSERTIYRDLAALESAGMPVVTYPGNGGGVGLMPGYALDKRLLSRRDMAALSAGLAGLSSLGPDDSVRTLLAKLVPEDAAALTLESDIIIDFSGWGGGEAILAQVRELRSLIAGRYLLLLGYLSASGYSERIVEPHKIIFKARSWYLYAWCRLREEFRLFKLSRMRLLRPLEEQFTLRPLTGLPLAWSGNPAKNQGEKVTLQFPPHCEFLVLDIFGPEGYRTQPDGSLMATFYSEDLAETLSAVLGFGPGVKVLENDRLKDMLLRWAREISELHQS